MRWIAHKFGGSSVANAARYQTVARLMAARPDEAQVVVVSAMQGVTDTLIGLTRTAAAKGDWSLQMAALKQRHLDTAAELLGHEAAAFATALDQSFADLAHLLRGVELLGTVPAEIEELVSGLGDAVRAGRFQAERRRILEVWG